MKRTKIVATLGPATDDTEKLEQMLVAGVNLVRINFSHGSFEEHKKRVDTVRALAEKHHLVVGVLADLQGPKIRVAKFKNKRVMLAKGDEFVLDVDKDKETGDENCVGIDYESLPQDVGADDILLLDDGRIRLRVKEVNLHRIICDVEVGGELSSNKGINRLGGGLSAPALTEKDKKDIVHAANLSADYVAVSFPRSADDMQQARTLIETAGSDAGLIAKIERTEAVENLDEIISASDAVMIARGDLAVEIGDAQVPMVQKNIITRARVLNKPVIVATQMMESMIQSKVPTRAEVSDVANAVLDLTDAVMLSAESAVGDHPAIVVDVMSRVVLAAEKQPSTMVSNQVVDHAFDRVDEAIAYASVYAANHLSIKAIICLTESGATPLWMSRIQTGIPIFSLSRHVRTRGKVTLYRDVYPIEFDVTKCTRDEVNRKAVETLQKKEFIKEGDLVILTKGDLVGILGGTNAMKILEVGKVA